MKHLVLNAYRVFDFLLIEIGLQSVVLKCAEKYVSDTMFLFYLFCRCRQFCYYWVDMKCPLEFQPLG